MSIATPQQLQTVLLNHPQATTVEDVLDGCKQEGITATFWSVYFAALKIGRKLTRRQPPPTTAADVREIAEHFCGLHKDHAHALATLDELQRLSDANILIDWRSETLSAEYGWELSVAQELAEHAGGISQARRIIVQL